MAYCAYRKKNKKRRLIIGIVSAFFATVAIIVIHLFVNVNPILISVISEDVKNTTTAVINETLKKVMGDNIKYNDIIFINRGKDDAIESISVNSILINNIARDTTLISQYTLKAIGQTSVNVPLGTVSGIAFFGGKGPLLNVNVLPVGSINITFKSKFESAGINNTMHSIMMQVDSSVRIIVPGLSQNVSIKTDVPIATTVIIGKIPDTYLQSGQLDEMLNLIP